MSLIQLDQAQRQLLTMLGSEINPMSCHEIAAAATSDVTAVTSSNTSRQCIRWSLLASCVRRASNSVRCSTPRRLRSG
jgi:hypothetical protein